MLSYMSFSLFCICTYTGVTFDVGVDVGDCCQYLTSLCVVCILCATAARQRYRVRDDKRRNEERASMNGRGVGGGGGGGGGSSYNSRSSGSSGTTSWSEGGDKSYLGGLGKYNKKDSSDSTTSAYSSAPAFSYNPQTNSITPNYHPPAVPTSAAYGQYTPYQNGAGATGGYTSYQQSGVPFTPAAPPPPSQQVYYVPPPPPPPPGQ